MRGRDSVSRSRPFVVVVLLFLLLSPYLNLIPVSHASTTPVAPAQQPVQAMGDPLPPGTVSYTNTWNSTLSLKCSTITAPSEPLTERSNNWTMTESIPSLLFQGAPTNAYIIHEYVLFPNGTLLVTDNVGNRFVLSGLAGFASGVVKTKLLANSTVAYWNALVTVGDHVLANVTEVFSVRHQFCQPAGLEIELLGTANWGTRGSGTVSLAFRTKPVSMSANRAWFGNTSGQLLGFDWSDSLSMNPTFNPDAGVLSYSVGPSFEIDPAIVGTTTNIYAISYGYQGRLFYANNYYWLFYYDGTHFGYRSSPNGTTWSSEHTITTGSSAASASCASYYLSATTAYYAIMSPCADAGSQFVYYDSGTLGSGTISWGTESHSSISGSDADGMPSLTFDTSGNEWLFTEYCSTNPCYDNSIIYGEVYEKPVGGSWTRTLYGLSNYEVADLVPLTSGKVALVGQPFGYNHLRVRTWSGSAWTTSDVVSGSYADLMNAGMVAIGTTVDFAGSECVSSCTSGHFTGVYSQQFTYGSSSWGSPALVYSASSELTTTVSADGSATLSVSFFASSSKVEYASSSDSGVTWSTPSVMSSSETLGDSGMAATGISGNIFGVAWISGPSSPFSIKFASFPSVIPIAASSSKSWSKPGLSPYESYFAHLVEYVSPGNGLLSIEQGDLQLPGRQMDLDVARVFSTPYGFRSTTPFQYDNYTLSNLGYGWSLNFPWMGTNYLHLTDGQAYPYSWSGTTFEYHGAVDFKLVANTGGTFTLYMPSGTLYQFDSSKRLTSVTDHTGNNTISLSYGSNNYVSAITDTIGRTVTFGYDGSNHLTSMSSGGRTWSYGYSGGDLVTATDPLGRVTTYQYGTGINSWLVSAVLYPTGGKSTYAYGHAPVGTDVKTYYVTSRNLYSSSSSLSLTSNMYYSVLNGNVVWSNSTISDGVSTHSYLDIHFLTSANSMKQYEKDSTGSLIRIEESDYDAKGRIDETKLISPSNALLAYSLSSYDSWGNLEYSRDNVGQQTWYSYSNTDSQNSFGSSGCTASFYTQSISSNVHDALLGQCAYQDGSGTPQMQTYYRYDPKGNLVEQKRLHSGSWLYTDYTNDRYGNHLSMTDALGRVTYYRYSSTYSSAYLTKQSIMVGTQNVTTTYTYDSAKGFLLSQTDPNGHTTSYQYDGLGRLTLTTYPAIGGVSSTKQYSYDDMNDVLTVTDENGNVVKQYYDGIGRQTKVERWNGSSVYSSETYTYNWLNAIATKTTAVGNSYTYAYDSFGRQTKLTNPDTTYQTISYDDVNNVRTATDENGHKTVYGYDWNNRLTSVKEYNATTTYFITTYSYDLSRNLLSMTDAKGQVTSYQYDDLNRLTTTTFPDTTTETRTYDSVGNMLTRTDPKGNTIHYAYDPLNRLTTVTYPDSSTVAYTHDPAGNMKSAVNPSVSDYYSYDARDRLTNQTEVVGSAYQTLYTYDGVGNALSVKYPDGYLLNITYDAVNRVKRIGSFATIAYTVDDMMSKITYGDGEVQTYTYDSRDRPTRILDKYGSTVELDLIYTYDGTGNVLTENTESYSYDWLDRLTSTTGPWGTITYTYDQVGNRVKMVQGGTPTTYSYGSFNRLTSAGSTTYTYDANGNMVAKNDGTSWTFSYDYENRLTNVVHSGSTVQQNFYDAGGDRVKKTETDTVVYAYQGLSILYEKDLTTGTVTKHFYANGQQVAKIVGSGTFYVHGDHLGSTRLVLTSSLTVAFSSNYVPYGPSYGSTGSWARCETQVAKTGTYTPTITQ
ncbi:MAG: hypothetical protein ABSB29_02085 [Nitrososphaerales archaeon]